MDYETLDPGSMREMVRRNLANLEAQHYQAILDKIANGGNPASVQQLDARIKAYERGLTNLRSHLESMPPEEPPTPTTPPEEETS